jgi:hypothetical protein
MMYCFITRIKNELHELLCDVPINQGDDSLKKPISRILYS